MNRGLVSRAVFVFGFCLPLAAFGILAEESVEAEPQPWDRVISALVDRAGRATATDHALALGIWAVAILVGGAALVSMANSSRRRALFSVIGALFVIGFGFSLVYLGWSNPSGVAAGWCVSVAWVSGLWLGLRRHPQPHAQEATGPRVFLRGLLRRKRADDVLDWVRFRVDTFPRSIGWLKPLGLPELHESTYQELPWVGVSAGRRSAGTKTRWENIEPLVEAYGVRSALDIGAGAGWFSFKLADHGVPAIAVDRSLRALRLGAYTRKRSGLQRVSFLSMEVTPSTANLLPAADCVLFLSVWHHFVREGGLGAGTEILARAWERAGKLLFFETGEDEMPSTWRLPPMLPDPRSWLTEYLEEVCTGATILHLGLHEALSPDDEPHERNLFVAVRGKPLPDQALP